MNFAPKIMSGIILKGHGDLDQLEHRTDLPVPTPGADQVLIMVLGTSVNNTDINTRIGWYSKAVKVATNDSLSSATIEAGDASWVGRPIQFPRIQGADCYGEIVGVGADVSTSRLGKRVLVKSVMHAWDDPRPYRCWSFGSECDGGFAEYAVAPSVEAFDASSTLSDEEMGCVSCTYGTAEGMLERANVGPADRILVIGASGGVGSAAVQLAKLRGAKVIAVVGNKEKGQLLREYGADEVLLREDDPLAVLPTDSLTCIVDLVVGSDWSSLLNLLSPGGRYAVAGAIGGPIGELDLRTVYLRDLTLFGCTYQDTKIMENLTRYLSKGQLKPRVAKTFKLNEIAAAQRLFMSKSMVGKIALNPF